MAIGAHLRKTFLAGILAAVPVAITVFVVWYVDDRTRILGKKVLGIDLPGVGLVVALAGIYLLGLVVTSLIGRILLRVVDRMLLKLPLLKTVYETWKHVALTPGEGMFAKVVLVGDEGGRMSLVGFTSGVPIKGEAEPTLCVFLPAAPNPTSGRLAFVPRSRCRFLEMTTEEAFKLILSGGNYLPAGLTSS